MNNDIFLGFIRFFLLIFLQVVFLDHTLLFGFINPLFYIYFVIVYPLTGNKTLLIVLAFLLGLSIDFFQDSGGIHAAASVFIAWVRPIVLKYALGVSYEYNLTYIENALLSQQLVYIISMVVVHHFVLFSLEIFNFSQIIFIVISTLFSSIFTIILAISSLYLFHKKNKK